MTWKEFVDEVNQTLAAKGYDPYASSIKINWIDIGSGSPKSLDVKFTPYQRSSGGELEISTVI